MKPLLSLTIALVTVFCTTAAVSAKNVVNLFDRYAMPYTNYGYPSSYGYPHTTGYGYNPSIGYTVDPYSNIYAPYGDLRVNRYGTRYDQAYDSNNIYNPYYGYDHGYVHHRRNIVRRIGGAILNWFY